MSITENIVRDQVLDIDAKLAALDKARDVLLAMKKVGRSSAVVEQSQNGVSTGFRDAIRQALKNHPQGLTGREIIQGLRSSGSLSLYKGATKPSIRVHNELFALGRKGEVVRKAKRYVLKDTRQ